MHITICLSVWCSVFICILVYKSVVVFQCLKLNGCVGLWLWKRHFHWLVVVLTGRYYSMNTSPSAEITCLMHKGWTGTLISPGRPHYCPKQLSHPVVCPPPGSHTSHCANMHIPPLSTYMCLCCQLLSQSTSTWWLNVPVSSPVSLKQPEKVTVLSCITGSGLLIPSKDSHFIKKCVCPFFNLCCTPVHSYFAEGEISDWLCRSSESKFSPFCYFLHIFASAFSAFPSSRIKRKWSGQSQPFSYHILILHA